jgi:hypothetical protein
MTTNAGKILSSFPFVKHFCFLTGKVLKDLGCCINSTGGGTNYKEDPKKYKNYSYVLGNGHKRTSERLLEKQSSPFASLPHSSDCHRLPCWGTWPLGKKKACSIVDAPSRKGLH